MLKNALRAIALDAGYLGSKRKPALRALAYAPFRVAMLMRLASGGGWLGRIARGRLLSRGIDVSPGARIDGALKLPHPVGIVVGSGVHLHGNTTIYQNVTVGGDGHGGYPSIETNVIIYPSAIVYGRITLASGTRVGAGVVLNRDTEPNEKIKAATR